jgi:hypothetical protein
VPSAKSRAFALRAAGPGRHIRSGAARGDSASTFDARRQYVCRGKLTVQFLHTCAVHVFGVCTRLRQACRNAGLRCAQALELTCNPRVGTSIAPPATHTLNVSPSYVYINSCFDNLAEYKAELGPYVRPDLTTDTASLSELGEFFALTLGLSAVAEPNPTALNVVTDEIDLADGFRPGGPNAAFSPNLRNRCEIDAYAWNSHQRIAASTRLAERAGTGSLELRVVHCQHGRRRRGRYPAA